MKILLIVPPHRTTDALVAQLYPQPYGLAMITAVLRAAGHEVEIKDFLLPPGKSRCDQPESFVGKSAPPYVHYGETEENVYRWLTEYPYRYRFDVYGLALGQCNLWEMGGKIARFVKETLKKPLVIGGPFATTAPDEALKITGADVLVQGEGESVAVEAFEAAARGETGKILKGAPLPIEELPLPAWDLCPPKHYPYYSGRVRGVLSVSRGCPFACEFCSVFTITGRRYRRLSPKAIMERLEQLAGDRKSVV